MEKFRYLRADEVEARVGTVKEGKGLSLLLYKDARCDMNLLDEQIGSERWQRRHEIIDGNLYCSVGIKFGEDWVWKQDVGTESNTEKEKGQASDAFKRACFNWGIGRELYTAPFIWIPAEKGTKYDKFIVKEMEVADGKITTLSILNQRTNALVYRYGNTTTKPKEEPKMVQQIPKINADQIMELSLMMRKKGVESAVICSACNVAQIEDMTVQNYEYVMGRLNNTPDAK